MPRPSTVSPLTVLLRLQARARAAARALPAGDAGEPGGGAAHLGIRVGGTGLLVPVREVAEICPLPALTRVPGAEAWLRGIAAVGGRVLAAVDVGRLLGGPVACLDRGTRIVVIEPPEIRLALLVDEVHGTRGPAGPSRPFAPAPEEAWLAGAVRTEVDAEGRRWGILETACLTGHPAFARASG